MLHYSFLQLWCFTQHRFVPRKDIVGVVKLSPEALREMLQQLAIPRVAQQQGWEFKLPTDLDFANRYKVKMLTEIECPNQNALYGCILSRARSECASECVHR